MTDTTIPGATSLSGATSLPVLTRKVTAYVAPNPMYPRRN